jgi:hypothetical protein
MINKMNSSTNFCGTTIIQGSKNGIFSKKIKKAARKSYPIGYFNENFHGYSLLVLGDEFVNTNEKLNYKSCTYLELINKVITIAKEFGI